MARIRTVKPEYFAHEELGACSRDARLLGVALMQLADSEGRFRWVPRQVQAHTFPWDDDIGTDEIEAMASELQRAGILTLYTVGSRRFAVFPNFRDHQRLSGKEATALSKHPSPEDATTTGVNYRGSGGEAVGKQRESQEQGTGKEEQGTGNRDLFVGSEPRPSDPKPKKKGRRKIERYAPNPSKAVLAVYAHWHGKHQTADDAPDVDQDAHIQALLDGGYSVADLCHVIDVTHNSDWHIREKKLGLDFCLRKKHVKDRLNEFKEHGGSVGPPPKPGTREAYPKAEELDGYGALVRLEGEYDDEPRPTACACGQQIPQEFAPVLGWYRFERCCAPKGAAG
jgi:hypothetical protein